MKRLQTLLLGVLVLPLQDPSPWKALTYSGVRPNLFSFQKEGLTIQVRHSASPLFHLLPSGTFVTGLKAQGRAGLPHLKSREGESESDDFALRVGLVESGERKLNWLEKILAPRWLKDLHTLLPDKGLGTVRFFNITQTWTKDFERKHPKNDILVEKNVATLSQPGNFEFKTELKNPTEVLAVWLQSDGDDSKSDYDVLLTELILETKD